MKKNPKSVLDLGLLEQVEVQENGNTWRGRVVLLDRTEPSFELEHADGSRTKFVYVSDKLVRSGPN
jgi:lipopolysaccharide export system protein LptA